MQVSTAGPQGLQMKNGYNDPKITPISAARRKAGKGQGPGRGGKPPRTLRDWLIGGLVIAMALGMVAYAVLAAQAWLSAVTR